MNHVESLKAIRANFTRWAPHYDLFHRRPLPYRRQAVAALGLGPGQRVLDLACGTGLNFEHLEQAVGPDGQIVGVDYTPVMLALARQRALRHGWQNVTLHLADAARLPFTGAQEPSLLFEAVICTYAMSIIPDYPAAVTEAVRVLKPSGRLVVLDIRLAAGWMRWLNPLVAWAGQCCNLSPDHRTLEAIAQQLRLKEFQTKLAGFGYLAVGIKTERLAT